MELKHINAKPSCELQFCDEASLEFPFFNSSGLRAYFFKVLKVFKGVIIRSILFHHSIDLVSVNFEVN